MSNKIDQIKIPINMNVSMYILTKPTDPKFYKVATQIFWLEWNEDGRFKDKHEEPKIGFSLIMDPYKAAAFTWQTTEITELIEDNEKQTHFKTKNSEYILTKSTN